MADGFITEMQPIARTAEGNTQNTHMVIVCELNSYTLKVHTESSFSISIFSAYIFHF